MTDKAPQDTNRRPMNKLADMAQAILDEFPPDDEHPGGSAGPTVVPQVPVAPIRIKLAEIRDLARGYDARRYRLDAVGKKARKAKEGP